MERRTRRSALLLAAASLALVVPPLVTRARQAQMRYRAGAAAAGRTEALCRLLVPGAGLPHLAAYRLDGRQADGRLFGVWSIDCTDQAGRAVLTTDWSADTGDLLYISTRGPSERTLAGAVPLSRGEAVLSAMDAMRTVGIAREAGRWYLAREPRLEERTWYVDWQAGDRAIMVAVDADTGEFLKAKVEHFAGRRSAAGAPLCRQG